MGTELEIKLHLEDQAQLARVLAWPRLAQLRIGAPYEIQMETTYLDTPQGDFAARHWTVRRRLENGRPILCVKTPREDPDALERGEWETEAASFAEGLPQLLADGAPSGLAQLAAQPLLAVCGARFLRRAQLLALPDGTQAELAADAGELFRGEKREAFCVLELELKQGQAETMLAFGKELKAQFGLHKEKKSKFARARSL